MKNLVALIVVGAVTVFMTACGGEAPKQPTVQTTVTPAAGEPAVKTTTTQEAAPAPANGSTQP